jgi:hypothetical protein
MAKDKKVKSTKPARMRKSKKITKPVEVGTTATTSVPAVAQQKVATPESDLAAPAVSIPATPATESDKPAITRSDAAKANIKEGLRLHQIAGRPTKQQLTLVFGQKGYLLTWPKRTEKFGIRPDTFQAALAKGVPAIPLAPVAKPAGEKAKENT